ncbi:MAG: V-type ATP synthase subunit B [Desulfuromonadales bacterium]|nr:V-type ATP synthase subunit B [Desulfuromonadales bacterium]
MRLAELSYKTVQSISGPLLILNRIAAARLGEMVQIRTPKGDVLEGEVLRIDADHVLIQLFGEPHGLDLTRTTVSFSDSIKQIPLSENCLGRVFDGALRPLDGLPMYRSGTWRPIIGRAINPVARAKPEQFIETGITAIDALNTLVKGQKLPIFSCAGLPSQQLTADILKHARTTDQGRFAIVFIALGLTQRDYRFYLDTLETLNNPFVTIANLADRPVVERLLAPRIGLTLAEHLAFDRGRDVLVVMTDMVNYCDAMREVATAREELPGRRGYPGYMYSDLASLYERAGRIKGRPGSLTMLPIVTMPEDDITHPIPDLTGYITEGQIVLSRELHANSIYPPIDPLPCLSRLMQHGIGAGRTREDHRKVTDDLYRTYARGRELRRLETIVGREGIPEHERRLLDFATDFETGYIGQGSERRSVITSLDLGLRLLRQYEVSGYAPSDPNQSAPA